MEVYRLFKQTDNPILELFLSEENKCLLQRTIIKTIKQSTGITISEQSERDLYGIMYNIYNERANTACPTSVHDEVRKLNGYVVDEAVANIKSGILMYLQYVKDASTLPVPMARSIPTTIDKSLEFTSNFI